MLAGFPFELSFILFLNENFSSEFCRSFAFSSRFSELLLFSLFSATKPADLVLTAQGRMLQGSSLVHLYPLPPALAEHGRLLPEEVCRAYDLCINVTF